MNDPSTPIEHLRPDLVPKIEQSIPQNMSQGIPQNMPQAMPQSTAPTNNPMIMPPRNTSPIDIQSNMFPINNNQEKERIKEDLTSKKVVSYFNKEDIKYAIFIIILFLLLHSQIVYRQIYKFIPAVYDQMGKPTTVGNIIVAILAAIIFILVKKFIL